jgi:hypothetical protein
VEETVSAMLHAEADELCKARRRKRTVDRACTRAGHCQRKFESQAVKMMIEMPRLRQGPLKAVFTVCCLEVDVQPRTIEWTAAVVRPGNTSAARL